MTPWRKRLGDLEQLVKQAQSAYFDPDLFRINVNSAIQTSRTVTFIIQKNKHSIQNFDAWYASHVLDRLNGDPVMSWLKESRNRIEKEGDLELHSECRLEAVYSYLNPGPQLSLKHEGLLFIGVKRLIRRIRNIFPTGVFRDSAIAVERRWVANSLPDFELIEALIHGYSVLLQIVNELDEYTGKPTDFQQRNLAFSARATRRVYLKAETGNVYKLKERVATPLPIDAEQLGKRYNNLNEVRQAFSSTKDLRVALDRFADVALNLLLKDGYHITIAIVLNNAGEPVQMIRTNFGDQTDKLIFWHELAFAAKTDAEFCGLIFISEIWFRAASEYPLKRISALPITGEALQVVATNRDTCFVKTIPFVKVGEMAQPELDKAEVSLSSTPNFLSPLRRVWEARAKS